MLGEARCYENQIRPRKDGELGGREGVRASDVQLCKSVTLPDGGTLILVIRRHC